MRQPQGCAPVETTMNAFILALEKTLGRKARHIPSGLKQYTLNRTEYGNAVRESSIGGRSRRFAARGR